MCVFGVLVSCAACVPFESVLPVSAAAVVTPSVPLSLCVCVFAVPCAVPCTVSLAAVAQGKSTVAAILSSRGFTVLNADAIAHRRYLERFRLCPFFPSFSLVALFTLFTLFTCG